MANTRPVSAFHVVGIDLELRLAVNSRTFREQEVLVTLTSISLLCVFAHDDTSVEDSGRSVIEDAFVKLPAAAVRLEMINHRVIVDVLLISSNVEAVERAFRAITVERNIHIVAYEGASKGDRVRCEAARTGLADLNGRDMKRLFILSLEFIVLDQTVFPNDDFSHRVREIGALSQREIIL